MGLLIADEYYNDFHNEKKPVPVAPVRKKMTLLHDRGHWYFRFEKGVEHGRGKSPSWQKFPI